MLGCSEEPGEHTKKILKFNPTDFPTITRPFSPPQQSRTKTKPEPRTVLYIIQLSQKPSRCIAALQPWHQVSKIVQFTPNSRCAPSRRGSTCATTTTALPQMAVPQHQMSIFYTRAAALFLLHFARRHEPVIIRHHQLHSAASAVLASWLERREPSIAVAIFKTSGSLPSRYHVNFSQH